MLRAMLLPVAADLEDASEAAVRRKLTEGLGVRPEDHATWLRLEVDRWRGGDPPSAPLVEVIQEALRAGDPELGECIALAYFRVHAALQGHHVFSHDAASILTSYSRLAARLARSERMSAAQIARVLNARNPRVGFTWRAVQPILTALQMRPSLDGRQVQTLWAGDEELEQHTFADADVETCAMMVSEVARHLACPEDLSALLLALYTPHGETFGPYLQMLYFMCAIAELYDHPPTALYEFAPRGAVAGWVFDRFPPPLTGAGNPFLNNAKAVERLDLGWAASRDTNRAAAQALARILIGMDELSFAARRELASWLRRWVLRLIRLARPLEHTLSSTLARGEIGALLGAVGRAETRTTGIIEQRVVDALTSLRHPQEEGWRGRGLRDPVNATNASRRKLGDCDYQNTPARRVVAYEAHAGRLTDVYLRGHIRMLERLMALRLEEWAGIADPAEWRVDIVFVAHALDAALPYEGETEGVRYTIRFEAFRDLAGPAERIHSPEDLLEAFTRLVISPLNERRTPNYVREVLSRLSAS